MDKKKKFTLNNLSKKDKLVALVSGIAVIALIVVLIYSRTSANNKQSQLSDISQEINNNELSQDYEGLMINEINKAGWIELYNSASEEQDISNATIWVNGKRMGTIADNTVIKSGEMYVYDTKVDIGNTGHDIVTLKDKDGNDVASELVPLLNSEESYGAVNDGSIEKTRISWTKGSSNNQATKISSKNIEFSVPGGFYDDAFNLEISAPEGCRIYYTTDGTQPTAQSAEYNGPIAVTNKSGSNYVYADSKGAGFSGEYKPESINMGMVVRAVAVDNAGNVKEEKSQSYFIGLAGASDYANAPVISITTNPENLFDYYEGMYVSGRSQEDAIARGDDKNQFANYLNGWSKNAHIEYFEVNKDKTYEADVELSMLKDVSVASSQKGFTVKGINSTAWDGSSLKAYFNDENAQFNIQTNQSDNGYKIRDYLADSLLQETKVKTSDKTPCIVFIDGEYWGVYMLKSDYDKQYFESNYGIGKDEDIITVRNKKADEGKYQSTFNDFYNYVTTHDMSDSDNYEKVKSMMDITNYIEYYCANMYLSNAAFGEDAVIWRTVSENGTGYSDGKWRWLMGRMDESMDNGINGEVSTSSIDSFLQPNVSNDKLFNSLLENEEFCNEFYNTMKSMSETTFSCEKTNEHISGVAGKIQKMAVSSYKRFIGNIKDDYYSNEIKKLQEFFADRGSYILRYTQEITKR